MTEERVVYIETQKEKEMDSYVFPVSFLSRHKTQVHIKEKEEIRQLVAGGKMQRWHQQPPIEPEYLEIRNIYTYV